MRGRPPGRLYSTDDIRLLEYLASISAKHEIEAGKFFNSFLDAFQHEEAACGELSIKCRVKTQDHAIFLITETQKGIAQFPIPTHILAKTNLLQEFTHRPSFMRNSYQGRTQNTKSITQTSLESKP
jgi:hypothetical protein